MVRHICGQLIGIIYTLLWKDYEQMQALAPGEEEPEPILYDPDSWAAVTLKEQCTKVS